MALEVQDASVGHAGEEREPLAQERRRGGDGEVVLLCGRQVQVRVDSPLQEGRWWRPTVVLAEQVHDTVAYVPADAEVGEAGFLHDS